MLIADTAQLCQKLGIAFSAEQLAAITAPHTVPQAIIAGAGSGKTAVMAARVVWLVGHVGIAPDKVLGLTFTAKAAAELSGRVRSSLESVGDFSDSGEPTVSTYHAFAGALITEHGLRLGIEPDVRILADASKYQLLARVLTRYDGPLRHVTTSLSKLVGQVESLDGQLSEHLVSTSDLRAFDEDNIVEIAKAPRQLKLHEQATEASFARIELSHLVDAYRDAKAAAGVMDFSDQMSWGASLAQLPEVAMSLRERFDVVLLDEYQDTSVAQRNLLQGLFSGATADTGRGHSVTAVGDPAQGIYGWRGAASGNLTGFLSDFPAAAGARGQLHGLTVSRRCGHEIIDLAGVVARDFYNDPDVAQHVSPLEAAPSNPQGLVSVALHETVTEEITALVDAVERAGRERRATAEFEPVEQWRETAILVRATGENSEIVSALHARGIPVEIVGLTGLLEQPEIRDIVAMLDVLDDVTANPSLLRLLAGPRWRIGDRDLALLAKRASYLSRPQGEDEVLGDQDGLAAALVEATRGTDPTEVVSLAEAVEDPGDGPFSDEARSRFASFTALSNRLRRQAHRPLPELVRRVISELDIDIELGAQSLPTDNVMVFIDAVARYAQHDEYASLSGLLAYLRAEADHNAGMEVSSPSESDSVKLLTVHRSKGLEFDHVFVPFVCGAVFPSSRPRSRWNSNPTVLPHCLRGDRDQLPDLQEYSTAGVNAFKAAWDEDSRLEEIRLGYVAFTRARHRLHLSGHRWGRTQKNPRVTSAFLDDARRWLEAKGRLPDVWVQEPAADETNPLVNDVTFSWPIPLAGLEQRQSFARLVLERIDGSSSSSFDDSDADDSIFGVLRADLDVLIAEARAAASDKLEVTMPTTLSATAAMNLAKDPARFARQLARPVPVKPSGAARFGTRFHAWVESRFGQQSLLDPSDLPGQADSEVADAEDLDMLMSAFESGPYARLLPHAIEAPFSIRLAGHQIIGRIDAVFETQAGFEIVDWKTNRRQNADPLQLAIYRLAWAELNGIDPASVTAAFYYVRSGEVVHFKDLPVRAEIEALLRLA